MEYFMSKSTISIIDHRSSKAIHTQLSPKGRNVTVSKVIGNNFFFEGFQFMNFKSFSTGRPGHNRALSRHGRFMQQAVKFLGKRFVSVGPTFGNLERYIERGVIT